MYNRENNLQGEELSFFTIIVSFLYMLWLDGVENIFSPVGLLNIVILQNYLHNLALIHEMNLIRYLTTLEDG
jgi:cellobiose-specific phosphotransferase system component IIC